MAWWRRDKETASKATREFVEKIDAIQFHTEISTLTSSLYDILSEINMRLEHIEKELQENNNDET
jgi:hypothetical protein